MSTTMQRELEINQAIDARLNDILERIIKLIDDSAIVESELEVSQIQNLVGIAHETGSVEVVKNFIRYQIGRDKHGTSWRTKIDNNSTFGSSVINQIDGLRDDVASLVAGESDYTDVDVDRIWMKMTRLYMGNLYRYFYYRKRSKTQGDDDENQ